MRIPLPSSKKRARIEIIPLIDIVFFLLATFVMVSLSMVKNQGMPVRLPSAATAARQDLPSYTAISITEAGEVYFNKEKISLDEVPAKLKSLVQADADPRLVINADERALFGNAVRVLDEARKLGIQKVSIQTRKPEEAA